MAFPRNLAKRRVFRHQRINLRSVVMTALLLPGLAMPQDDDDPTSSPAQVSEPFVDQITGINMERFFGARTSFGFAFALPEVQSTTAGSFIGQLSFPLVNGKGWGAFGLTGDMEGNFILAVWPGGNSGVMASFRQATNEDNPPEVIGNFRVRPLPDGVSVNATFLLYTFLCENCLDSTLGLGPEAAASDAVMGWALSERPPMGDPSDPGARLGFHERGFGPFTARLGAASTSEFDAVAARALDPIPASSKAVPARPGVFGEGSGNEDSGEEFDGDVDMDEGEDSDSDNDDD